MAMPGIVIKVAMDAHGAISDLNKLEKKLDTTFTPTQKLSRTFDKLTPALAAAGAAAGVFAVKFGVDSVNAASDFNEALSKSQVVFGTYSKDVEAFADTAVDSMGATSTAALEAAGTFGNLLTSFGTGQQDAARMSTSLVQLAADLGSFNNVPIDEVFQALRSGLSGETEPLKRFGIALSDTRLKAEAAALGLGEIGAALTPLQKSQAAYSLILKDSTNAQGDFQRTGGGFANQMKKMQAATEEFSKEFGVGFLEVVIDGNDHAGDLNDTLDALAPALRSVGREFGEVAKEVLAALSVIGKLSGYAERLTSALDDSTMSGGALKRQLKATLNPAAQLLEIFTILDDILPAVADSAEITGVKMQAMGQRAFLAARGVSTLNQALANGSIGGGQAAKGTIRAIEGLGAEQKNIDAVTDSLYDLWVEQQRVTESTKKTGGASRSAANDHDTHAKAVERLQKNYDLAKKSIDDTRNALDTAQGAINSARDALNSYAETFGNWIASGVGIKKAFEDAADINKAAAKENATVTATSWLEQFDRQIAEQQTIRDSLKNLKLSLDPANVKGNQLLMEQLMQLEPGQAAQVADDMVNKNLAPAYAAQLAALNADDLGIGITFANMFYQSGVDAAYAQYNAIRETLESKLADLEKLGRQMAKAVNKGYNSVGGASSQAGAATASASSRSNTPTYNVTVNGALDPVAVARQIERIMAVGRLRTGRPL